MSKAFDKVYHEGLISKLKAYGIEGKLLSLLENYLQNCKQRVVLTLEKMGVGVQRTPSPLPPVNNVVKIAIMIFLIN